MIALLYEMNGNLSCIKNRRRLAARPVTAWLENASRVRASDGRLADDNMGGRRERCLSLQTLITGRVYFTCPFKGYFWSIKTLRKRATILGNQEGTFLQSDTPTKVTPIL